MNEIVLDGCSPVLIAHYLKALGIHRTISKQMDPSCRSAWRNDTFVLYTRYSIKDIVTFYEESFQPSPIVAPWNGGSGYFPGDKGAKKILEAVVSGKTPKFEKLRNAIKTCRTILDREGIVDKPEGSKKRELLEILRSELSDETVEWLDAAFILTGDSPKFPPLLGKGAIDARLEFSKGFATQVLGVFDRNSGQISKHGQSMLAGSLFGLPVAGQPKDSLGQFFPSAAGGYNSTSGFKSDSKLNPWDFIFLIEGIFTFTSAAIHKFGTAPRHSASAPFTVRASANGFATSTESEESFNDWEIWMPLWSMPASFKEVEQVFREGRAELGGKTASNGIDFYRAACSLGVDRGITEFQRFGLIVRNGDAHYATPLDRVRVKRNPDADLIAEIDPWLRRFRQKAKQDSPSPPSSMTRALRRIEDGIIRFCKSPEPANAQTLFIALGEGEKALNTSVKWAEENFLKPLGGLSARWIELSDDGTPEFRLAASLGSMVSRFGNEWMTLRSHLEPIRSSKKAVFWKPENQRDVMWHDGEFVDVMNRILQRRLLMENRVDNKEVTHLARVIARPADIAKFIEKRTDDAKIAKLLWSMVLVEFPKEQIRLKSSDDTRFAPPSMYALLRSCFPRAGQMGDSSEKPDIPLAPIIHRRAADNQGTEASRLAARRLHASGLRPAVSEIAFEKTERIAAAMLFPLSRKAEAELLKSIQRPSRDEETRTEKNDTEPQSITI